MGRPQPPIGAGGSGALGLRSRLARRLPRTLKVTATGRTYLVVTLGVGLGALNTGNNLLYLVLSLLLSVVVASGILSERCLSGLQVRRLGAKAPFAAEPFAYRWAVSRPRGHAFALRLSEQNPGLLGEGKVAHVPPGEEVVVRGDLLAARRGPHLLSGIRVTTSFPFGLFAKTRVIEVEQTLLVFPRRAPPGSKVTPEAAGAEEGTDSSQSLMGGAGEVGGLVPHQEGDDARRIHWQRSASLGRWVRLERAREERRTVVLRPRTEAPSVALERECEALAALARLLLARGDEVGFSGEKVALRPGSGPAQEGRILAALAQLGFEEVGR